MWRSVKMFGVMCAALVLMTGCEPLLEILLPSDGGAQRDVTPKPRVDEEEGAGEGASSSDALEAKVLASNQGNTKITSFSRSKKELLALHEGHAKTFYCGCSYSQDKSINLESCGYKVRKSKSRASRVEYEHVMPASHFGRKLDAWTKGHDDCVRSGRPYKGRQCAERASKLFKLMQADMYNLQPAIGEVNGDRSDAVIAELDGEPREYGRCDVEVRDGKVEPAPSIRGDVARTYLYMEWAYPGLELISADDRAMLERWSAQDPVDDWERERAKRIQRLQGNANPFIK